MRPTPALPLFLTGRNPFTAKYYPAARLKVKQAAGQKGASLGGD